MKFLSEAKLINQSIEANPLVVSLNDWKMSGATNNAGAGRKVEGECQIELRPYEFWGVTHSVGYYPQAIARTLYSEKRQWQQNRCPTIIRKELQIHPQLSRKKGVKNDYVQLISKGQQSNQKSHWIKKNSIKYTIHSSENCRKGSINWFNSSWSLSFISLYCVDSQIFEGWTDLVVTFTVSRE